MRIHRLREEGPGIAVPKPSAMQEIRLNRAGKKSFVGDMEGQQASHLAHAGETAGAELQLEQIETPGRRPEIEVAARTVQHHAVAVA